MDFFDKIIPGYANGGYDKETHQGLLRKVEAHECGVAGCGITGPYGLFHAWFVAPRCSDGTKIRGIVVAHEGDWTGPLHGYHQYSFSYDAIQKKLGENLKFVGMEFSKVLGRTLIRYDFEDEFKNGLLFTPATGEEIYFEIYGIGERHGMLHLMLACEA